MSIEIAKKIKNNVKKQEKQKKRTTENKKSCSQPRQKYKIPAPGNWPARLYNALFYSVLMFALGAGGNSCQHACGKAPAARIPPCVYTHATAACIPPCVNTQRANTNKFQILNPKSSIPNFARGRAFCLRARRLFTHAPARTVRSRGTSSRGAGGCGPSGGGVFPRMRRGAAPAGRRLARRRAGRGRGRGGRR